MPGCSFCGDNRNDSGLDISISGICPLTVVISLLWSASPSGSQCLAAIISFQITTITVLSLLQVFLVDVVADIVVSRR